MMMGYGFGGPVSWIGMGFGFIIHLAFAALIIMGAVWMFKALFNSTHHSQNEAVALDIVKQRYAKGEITAEEYRRMTKELA
jgi:putative membrane protein